MGITYSIDAPARIIRLELVGEVGADEWTATMREILKNPTYRPGFGVLVDRRRAAPVSAAFTKHVLGFLMLKQKQFVGACFALVLADPASFEMGRMGKTLAEEAALPIQVEVFQDVGAAERWLLLTGPEG